MCMVLSRFLEASYSTPPYKLMQPAKEESECCSDDYKVGARSTETWIQISLIHDA